MPDCFSVPDAGAKCSSARTVTGARGELSDGTRTLLACRAETVGGRASTLPGRGVAAGMNHRETGDHCAQMR